MNLYFNQKLKTKNQSLTFMVLAISITLAIPYKIDKRNKNNNKWKKNTLKLS